MSNAAPKKEWRYFNDDCLHCGGDAEVLTDTGEDNLACDGDEARCTSCGCPGHVSCDDERGWINWHDEPDCDCEWCKKNPA